MQLLSSAPLNTLLHIHHLNADDSLSDYHQHLQDLGFLPGESVIVQRKAPLGHDPIVVRVGSSTYVLRRGEAKLVHVI